MTGLGAVDEAPVWHMAFTLPGPALPPLAGLALRWPWGWIESRGSAVSPTPLCFLHLPAHCKPGCKLVCFQSCVLSSYTQLTDFLLRLCVWWRGEGLSVNEKEVNKIPQAGGWASVLWAQAASLAQVLMTPGKVLAHGRAEPPGGYWWR
jgi:hypothetical protein